MAESIVQVEMTGVVPPKIGQQCIDKPAIIWCKLDHNTLGPGESVRPRQQVPLDLPDSLEDLPDSLEEDLSSHLLNWWRRTDMSKQLRQILAEMVDGFEAGSLVSWRGVGS